MKNLFTTVLLAAGHFWTFLSPLQAQTASDVLAGLPPALRQELLQKGELTNFGGSLGEMNFLSGVPGKESLKTALGNPECNVAVEALFWIPRSKLQSLETGNGSSLPGTWDPVILGALGRFSAMKGLEYYSVSRKRMEVLIQESSLVPGNKGPKGEAVVFQKDNTFGGNHYYVSTTQPRPGLTTMTMENQETMYWGLVPLVSPGNFRMGLQVRVLEEGILIYGLSTVRTLGLFGLERAKEDSFYNRLKAFSSWLEKQLVKR